HKLVWFHLAALTTIIFWGSSFVSTRVLLNNGLHAVEIYIYRFLIAYFFILFVSHKRLWANSLRDEVLLALCGLTSGSIYFIAENVALKYTYVANVSLITSISPLLTTLLIGMLYRNERPAKAVYLGSLIAIVGVSCVVFNSGFNFQIMPLGDLLALSAAFSFAIYSIILRKVNSDYTSMFITRKTFFYGLVTSIPFFMMEPEVCGTAVLMRPSVIFNIAFLGICCSLLGFFFFSKATSALGAIVTNNYLYLQSVVTLILAYVILNETISLVGYLGCALILAGLILSDRLAKK
ncbi:MAG: DMT family transporter, partial [Muribaculaceae bacterium]|nr:DMT family transporter [Muribaculaceae bacterium]